MDTISERANGAAPRARRTAMMVVGLIVVAGLALPTLAADPTPAPGKPAHAAKPEKEKVAKVPVTLSGTVTASTDADGRTTYTLTAGGKTYELGAGPSWFHGDKHPLKAFIGKSVTIAGESASGSIEVDVLSVNGSAIREAGKPAWAGGWKRVGKAHPGWSQEKADRLAAKFGDCFPPGRCRSGTSE